jgi:uncharacterized protein
LGARLSPRAAVLAVALLIAAAPSPRAEVRLPPHGDRSVHDLARVLSPEDVAAMERMHRDLFARTGVAIVVVTVDSLEGESIEDFAVRVGEEWGAGRKGEDRGIVVALATADRRVFIATGYGVEGYLPDGRVGAILDDHAIPHLKREEWSAAMRRTSAALVAASAAEYGVTIEGSGPPPRSGGRRAGGRPGVLQVILFLIGGAVLMYIFIRNPLLFVILMSGSGGRRGSRGRFGGGGFGGRGGFGGFGGGGFGGGGAGRGF